MIADIIFHVDDTQEFPEFNIQSGVPRYRFYADEQWWRRIVSFLSVPLYLRDHSLTFLRNQLSTCEHPSPRAISEKDRINDVLPELFLRSMASGFITMKETTDSHYE
ncbi:hypothetical protein CEXT_434481 [Caerostris extrusa]|uniref:Uncharacterized protein n=1 Tax=Caerostris extrusa TaxID=172846 RepID=A0AAV4MKF6_CAEEX|nr:hypothetical protein CEXT_434481 [Caerostris extrusa]